ncbi:MAG: hypothetical protein K9H25_21910 [Rhodospirillum sp.]|nr:hypothetical protein [Rhodospirillum sp.]MCF8491756.1 hypothetical protein [Rhodospirillum sp.]MCF8501636.1 hypothetical protein [Rhodospirillum sp.]
MEDAADLIAVGFDVRGVDIQGDPLGWAVVAFQEEVDVKVLETGRLGGELVIAPVVVLETPLHSPQGGTPGKGFGRLVFLPVRFAQELQQGIVAQARGGPGNSDRVLSCSHS